MNLRDDDHDWITNPAAAPDEFERGLERALAPARYDVARRPLRIAPEAPPARRRSSGIALAMAASVALVLASWLALEGGRARDEARVGGTFELVEARGLVAFEPSGRLACGPGGSARLGVGTIGTIELGERSRLRLERARADDLRVFLEEGSLSASIFAAPRVFSVGTPAGVAVDLGCVYRTTVEPDGTARIQVQSGRVSFEKDGVHALVPAGAECRARPDRGIGLPYWSDADPLLVGAVARFDSARAGSERQGAIDALLAASRVRDSLTLFHLLERSRDGERPAIVLGLTQRVGRPEGIDLGRVSRGDPAALGAWRDVLRATW